MTVPSHPETSYMTSSELYEVPKRFKTSLWPLLDFWKRYNSSKYNHNFRLYRTIAENLKIPLSVLKSAETVKMGLISISDVKKVKWTMFEQNPMENKWFQFFISGTPDSWRIFFVLALTPPRVAKSTCLFYIHNWFWLQIFRISWKIDNLFTRTKVMAFQSWGKKSFGIPKK